MSPHPCLKHIDDSFLVAKWVPNSLSRHIRCSHRPSLHSYIPALPISHLTSTYQTISFLCTFANCRNALFSTHYLMIPIHLSISTQSYLLHKGFLGRASSLGQASLRGGPRAHYAWSTGTCITCSIYPWLCSVYVTLSSCCTESSSKRRAMSNLPLYS